MGQCVPRLRHVILDDCGRRSVGGDLLLHIPLFYGQATVGAGTVIIVYIGVACTGGGGYLASIWRVPGTIPGTVKVLLVSSSAVWDTAGSHWTTPSPEMDSSTSDSDSPAPA